MKKLLLHVAAALALATISLSVLAAAQFGKPKEPQDHTRTLTGHVFGRQDQPVAKAIVYLKNTKSLAVKTYISDPDGGYRFPALSPNVDYEVYADYNGSRSDTKTLSAFDNRKQVNITLRIK
ncbi:MAG TPA: carboxypeptidase-like regulatory domain-containing protein [Candidatus Angelobacter sp.]|nr:carboxypeptidase-like regulatory domain-containing protein [Candidatus Angelobacter sp.]